MIHGYKQMILATLIAIFASDIPVLQCYPYGAPESACTSLKPSHSGQGNEGPPPFDIILSQQEYLPGDTIQVQLQRNDGQTFKGFILQARRTSSGSNQDDKIGTFTNINSGTKYNCQSMCNTGSSCSITHVNESEKTQVAVDWIAPAEPEGDLVFKASFVECYQSGGCSVYWYDIPSQVVTGPPEEGVTGMTSSSEGPGQTLPPLPSIDLTDCGILKGCFRSPADCTGSQDCTHLVTWISRDEEIDFEISATVSGGDVAWIAVAFSLDESMGDDSVVDCVYDETRSAVIVQSSWNNLDKTNEVLSDPGLGLVSDTLQGSYVDGQVLQCSFTRLTSLNTKSQRNDDKIYDLNEAFYMLLGKGPVSSGVKNQHSEVRISPETVTISSSDYVNIGGSIPKFPLVITHGSLMIIAWMLLASIGVMMPRYFKKIWKNHIILDKALWFQIHRPVMSLVLLLSSVAFIVIFVEVGGYATYLKDVDAAHPILGIIVMILVIVNPVMAIFRPNPDGPRRPIFNVAHFIVGTSAHVFGAVTMFLGTRLPKAGMSDWAQWIVVAFACWHCMVEIILLLHQYIMRKKGLIPPTESRIDLKSMEKVNGFQNELYQSSSSAKELSEKTQEFEFTQYKNVPKFETVMICVHFCILLALSLALIVDLAA